MKATGTIRLVHPEPCRDSVPLLPVFLPFAGCPGRCVFCDQGAQTGVGERGLEQALHDLESQLSVMRGRFGLGFFGGTFTGLPVSVQERFLELAGRFRNADGLVHLRVSTRPDRVDAGTLARLRSSGVTMVELGVQTFDTGVLGRSGRGYTGPVAAEACGMVRDAGLGLGIQLLPGLPGHGPAHLREDVRISLTLRPDVARIYPCVVMDGTALAGMFARGEYAPWSLEAAVSECGGALLRFWEAGVRVIRLGLAAEDSMLSRMIAGPWHPAFGNMARATALRLLLEEQLLGERLLDERLGRDGRRVVRLFLPRRLGGELWGHGRANAPALERIGITKEKVTLWSEADIVVELG